jgi:diguanylate cyclase (GGDEF)-like protein/PAS domain S-box-containing protein
VVVTYPDGDYGILTERDLIRPIAQAPSSQTVGELASKPLHAVPQDMSLYRARSLLSEAQIRHIGVLDGTDLLGLVSFAEIMMDIEVAYVHELQQALQVRDHALAASRRSLRLAERFIEDTREGVMITDADGHTVSVNPAFSRLTGYSAQEVLGKRPSVLSSGHQDQEFYAAMWRDLRAHGHWRGEIWNRRKSGEVFPEFLSITAITDEQGEVSHYAGLFTDISRLKEEEANIRSLAYRDPLTGLPNRRLLDDRLDMAIAQAHRHGRRVGVLFLDLDRFKNINDSFGHAVGDEVLIELARRLEACVREGDTVARLGGDEFIVILADIEQTEEAWRAAERILAALRQPLLLQGQELPITCSLGLSVYPDHGTSREILLGHADAAMYRVKESGRDGLSLQPAHTSGDLHLLLDADAHSLLSVGRKDKRANDS